MRLTGSWHVKIACRCCSVWNPAVRRLHEVPVERQVSATHTGLSTVLWLDRGLTDQRLQQDSMNVTDARRDTWWWWRWWWWPYTVTRSWHTIAVSTGMTLCQSINQSRTNILLASSSLLKFLLQSLSRIRKNSAVLNSRSFINWITFSIGVTRFSAHHTGQQSYTFANRRSAHRLTLIATTMSVCLSVFCPRGYVKNKAV